MARAALPILDSLQIASPCTADWNLMEGDDHQRFCSQCSKHVYNLPLLTPDELVDLIHRTEGKFCGRLFKRRDDTVLTEDCPVGRQRVQRRVRRVRAISLGAMSFFVSFGIWGATRRTCGSGSGSGMGGGGNNIAGGISVDTRMFPQPRPPVEVKPEVPKEPHAWVSAGGMTLEHNRRNQLETERSNKRADLHVKVAKNAPRRLAVLRDQLAEVKEEDIETRMKIAQSIRELSAGVMDNGFRDQIATKARRGSTLFGTIDDLKEAFRVLERELRD